MEQNCHSFLPNSKVDIPGEGKTVLLMGNPNVGKSVVFSRLTGANVVSSNYAGTTVDYCHPLPQLPDAIHHPNR